MTSKYDDFADAFAAACSLGGHDKDNSQAMDEYSKGQYRQAKKAQKDLGMLVCGHCGKKDKVKLMKCSSCLSVSYCSKKCQVEDWKTNHKKVCKTLREKDRNERYNAVDRAGGNGGNPIIPLVGFAVSGSITGLRSKEVLCEVPFWDVENELRTPFKYLFYDNKENERSMRYFFKTYYASGKAAGQLSVKDIGNMCMDAALLYFSRHPSVRRISPEEGAGDRTKFAEVFHCFSPPPKDWVLKPEDVAHHPPELVEVMRSEIEKIRNDPRCVRRDD